MKQTPLTNPIPMKRYFLLTVVLFAIMLVPSASFAGPESIPSKEMMAPAPEPEPCNWTGFYLGVQGGYGFGDLQWTQLDHALIVDQDHDGFFVGGEQGYNYQIGRWFLIGIEGDFSYSEVNGTTSRVDDEHLGIPGPNRFETGTDWMGTVGLRAGITYKRFLFFAKGGVSFAHLEYSWFATDTDPTELAHDERFSSTETRAAPMVGGGLEYMLTCHWSAKLEYKHIFLGGNHVHGVSVDIFPGPAPEVGELETFKARADQNQIQFGLNYKL